MNLVVFDYTDEGVPVIGLHRKILLLIVLSLISFVAFGKGVKGNSSGIFNFTIDSKVLKRDQMIQVYLPENYQDDALKKYPVMYIMDGDWYFLHGVGYQKSLTFHERSPEFIVIGIKTAADLPTRHSLLRTEDWNVVAPRWINFLSQELLPYVDKHYRSSKERIYFGWELAGTLGEKIFTEYTELFTAYILVNITTYDQKNVESALGKAIKSGSAKGRYLYIAAGGKEAWEQKHINALSKFLEENSADDLKWRFDVLDGQDHYSAPMPAIYYGLQEYFSDYPPVRFYDLEGLAKVGGIEALYQYYRKRGERYNTSTKIHNNTLSFLFGSVYRSKDIAKFKKFFKTFENHFETDYWYAHYADDPFPFDAYAEFCLENNELDIALELYQIGVKRKPTVAAKLHSGIANIYRIRKDYKRAVQHYQRAIDVANQYSSPELPEYKTKLSELKNK